MSREETNASDGINFAGLLQIAFIVLKLCNVITWKWVYVLMPIIISAGITIILLIILVITSLIGKST